MASNSLLNNNDVIEVILQQHQYFIKSWKHKKNLKSKQEFILVAGFLVIEVFQIGPSASGKKNKLCSLKMKSGKNESKKLQD